MNTIFDYLAKEFKSEYESEYVFDLKKNFSAPKIYSANGDLTKRWYVYFSFREPTSGKLKRQTPIYANANKYKTKEDRLAILVTYRKVLLKLLKKGYNPYQENKELYNKHALNSVKRKEKPNRFDSSQATKTVISALTYKEAFQKGLRFKEKLISKTTKRSYENRLKNFTQWVETNHQEIKFINQIDKKLVMDFLNEVLDKTSPRNRNNYRTDLSSLMQVLEDNDIIQSNFIKKIPVLKATPKRNKTYSNEEQEAIFKHLEKNDKDLLLFIKFISYNFLRPIEVCRLKVGDLDLKNKRIQFKAKNSPLKTKIIPDLLLVDIPDLSRFNKNDFLFTPNGIGGEWSTDLDNKRDYFTKRFKRVVKDPFNLGVDYGLYSFRHTFITKLYRELVKGSSPFAAKSTLMLITGHSSMKALEKYLRDIDAEYPEDYSVMLENSNQL